MDVESRLKNLGISLSDASDISDDVTAYRVAGKMIYTSGLIPHNPNGSIAVGKVGTDISTEKAAEYVHDVAVQLLSALNAAADGLDNIKQIVMLQCFANAAADYTEQSKLFNPASELFSSVFGENGKHARFALGMGSLPMNVPVEISVIAEMK